MNTVGGVLKLAIEAITGFNESVTFFQWFRSLRPPSNETENQQLKEDVGKLCTSLESTVRVMRDLINRAEWNSHEERVAELLPELKAAFYDAEDLLEDFRYYEHELKVQIEGSAASSEPSTKSFRDDIQGDLDKFNCTKKKLDELSSRLKEMGLHPTLRFDRSVRPETTSFSNEPKIFGRDDEKEKLIRLLGVPSRPKRKRSAIHSSAINQVCAAHDNNEATMTSVPVLPIVGIGGLGKTTLAQEICRNAQVREHFNVIVWICVSDDFDVKRLTKEAIEQFSRQAPTTDNLNSLQVDLEDRLNKGRFLIVLDDIWTENGELWNTFFAPFKHVLQGSMMLVTTRSQKVANIVRTTDPFLLEGLKGDFLRNLFKLCAFASDNSNNDPELERIGEQILPKLKGSPLAAKTLGRLLGRNLDPKHWNNILNSQLWELPQKGTDILPALRLSYMYLPFHLKRCFSFCAVYPKDHNFEKEDLAEIWIAEGFVVPEKNIPLQRTARKHFEELEYLSFFQKHRGKFVMHDLIHDMAQLVSEDECFIIKEKRDLERIPPNVRHLSVLGSGDFECSDLGSLCKQTKLRTLLCYKSLKSKDGNTMVKKWCNELLCMRVMVCQSISKWGLPDSITNMKNLRYLKIIDSCLFKHILAALCRLYNLQLLSARKCSFEEIPRGFSKLINLQKFQSQGLKIDAAMENGEEIRLLTDVNLITRDLFITNVCEISQDQAAKIELMKDYISSLTLKWSEGISPKHNEVEAFEALHPPTNIKSVHLECYPGESLPSCSHGSQDPTIFSSLTEITVIDCPRLSSLEHFLQPDYIPAIKQMVIEDCPSLEFVPVERFGDLPSLERLEVRNCPKINSQCLLAPSLKGRGLHLINSGNLGNDIDCRFCNAFYLSGSHLASVTLNMPLLTWLTIKDCIELETLNGGWPVLKGLNITSCPRLKWENGIVLPSSLQVLQLEDCGITHVASIPGKMWSSDLKSLERLRIVKCQDLVSIGGPEAIAHVRHVHIEQCPKLKEIQQPLYSSLCTNYDLKSCTNYDPKSIIRRSQIKHLCNLDFSDRCVSTWQRN